MHEQLLARAAELLRSIEGPEASAARDLAIELESALLSEPDVGYRRIALIAVDFHPEEGFVADVSSDVVKVPVATVGNQDDLVSLLQTLAQDMTFEVFRQACERVRK